MEITLGVTLWTHKPDKDGLCPIAISIRGGGDQVYYSPKIKVHPDYWNGSEILKGVDNYDILNNSISTLIKNAEREILIRQAANEVMTLEKVKDIMQPANAFKGGNFMKFYNSHIEYLQKTKSPGYAKHYKTEYTTLKKHAGDKLSFADITDDFLKRYQMSLSGLEPTTVNTKMKRLRTIVLIAIKKELISTKQIAGYKFPGYEQPETFYLTLAQTKKLADMIYTGKLDSDPTLKTVACFFLVECYGGIRFADWSKFEVEKLIHNRNFKVRAGKNSQPIYLDLSVFKSLNKILTYIKKKGLRFTLTEKTANLMLKTVGDLLGLTFELSTHDGRRTFGTLLGEMGYSTRFISEAMGITEKMAKVYVHITKQSMNAEQERIGGF